MAKLQVQDPMGLGEYLIEAARDPKKRAALKADPIKELGDFVSVPEGHTIVIHEDTGSVTNIMIPWSEDVERSLELMKTSQRYTYPRQYNPNDPAFIDPEVMPDDPQDTPPDSYKFRIADYSLSRCG